MNVETVSSRQIHMNITEDGQQRAALYASFRSTNLSINVDVFDEEWTNAHRAEMAAAYEKFLADVTAQAAQSGLPVLCEERL